MGAWLEDDSPMVEEFELPLRPAAGRDFWRGTVLVTTAQFVGLLSAPLPGGGGGVVLRCVRLFVWCWCTLRRVMYEYFLILYDVAMLLPFISKKQLV